MPCLLVNITLSGLLAYLCGVNWNGTEMSVNGEKTQVVTLVNVSFHFVPLFVCN